MSSPFLLIQSIKILVCWRYVLLIELYMRRILLILFVVDLKIFLNHITMMHNHIDCIYLLIYVKVL